MGLLDSVMGALAGAQGSGGGGGQADLLRVVVGMLAQGGPGGGAGGLGDLIGRFQQGGLGHLVDSWVGTGENLPISADQLHSVLGSDTVAQIAGQLGLSHADAADQLSQVLPQAVDQLTPHGRVPDEGLGGIGDILAQLSNVLGPDVIGQIASQLGLSHGDAAGQLSQMLPEVINRLTPHGQAPSGGLGAVEDILAQLTAKR